MKDSNLAMLRKIYQLSVHRPTNVFFAEFVLFVHTCAMYYIAFLNNGVETNFKLYIM